ncbi:hypothetical protein FF38_04254 [Lucilia cuprina]|uniref:Uncharacterized protein n=1 Tax=Lucilia cuprina TaxID=7375 RepID=A0A0L0C1D5_LUCCU|nr:hypothetical protein FF38_04254 [Lucilia cuprina]
MKLDDYNIRIRMSNEMENEIHNSFLIMITIDLRPLSIVENKGFQEFTKSLNSKMIDNKKPYCLAMTNLMSFR